MDYDYILTSCSCWVEDDGVESEHDDYNLHYNNIKKNNDNNNTLIIEPQLTVTVSDINYIFVLEILMQSKST